MQKRFCFFALLALMFSLAGCDGDSAGTTKTTSTSGGASASGGGACLAHKGDIDLSK